jgi:hypothetical protein
MARVKNRSKGESKANPPVVTPSEVASEVERTIRSVAPDLGRMVKYGAPTFQGRGDVITSGVGTQFVGVGFWNGAKLAARHLVLEGISRPRRRAKLGTLEDAKSRDYRVLIRGAVKLDAVDPVHPKQKPTYGLGRAVGAHSPRRSP